MKKKKSTRADKICIDVKFSPVFSLKHTQRERTAVLLYRNSSTNDIRTQSLILIRPSRKTHNVRKSLKTSRFFETFLGEVNNDPFIITIHHGLKTSKIYFISQTSFLEMWEWPRCSTGLVA